MIGGQIAPYIPIDWVQQNTPPSAEARGGVEEVYCGPATNPDLKEKAVKDLLIAHNCGNTRVLQSKGPLRA
jgi:hypothetical protein